MTRILLDNMWFKISREKKIPTSSKMSPVVRIEDKQDQIVIYLPEESFNLIYGELNQGEFQIIQWALEHYKRYLGARWVEDMYYERILSKVKKIVDQR